MILIGKNSRNFSFIVSVSAIVVGCPINKLLHFVNWLEGIRALFSLLDIEGGNPMRNTRKTTKLRQMMQRPELSFLMEAHSGLSARLSKRPVSKGSGRVVSRSPP